MHERAGHRAGAARRALALASLLALWVGPPAHAQPDVRPRFDDVRGGAQIVPNVAKLGERVTYRATIHSGGPIRIRVFTPREQGAFHWGPLTVREEAARPSSTGVGAGAWTLGPGMGFVIEAPLQVFALGDVAVPGLMVEVDDGRGARQLRLPVAHVAIAPVVAATDSAADLHALRGPIAAPWWERVPWIWVVVGLLLVAGVVALMVARRRQRVAPPAPVVAGRPRDPVADALRELEALRRMGLPAQARFDEHALQLTRIARRFLEAVAGHTRPGDTTPEVVEGLATSRLDHEDVRQVEGLLRMWDRLKFARAQSSADECARAEAAVESLVRRHARPLEPPAAPVPPDAGKAA